MEPYLLMAGAALAPAGVYAVSCIAEVRGLHDWLVPGAVWRVDAPHVVLTFDDGPDPVRTPRLLDVLAQARARAVFFVVGERVREHPDLVKRMADEGHQIGNHSWSHPFMPRLGRRRIEAEIDRCQEAVREITGTAPTVARPPYGMRDYRYYRVLRERALTPVLWSRNLRDYYGSQPPALVRRLNKSKPGEIILCHDGDPLAPNTAAGIQAWLATQPALGLL